MVLQRPLFVLSCEQERKDWDASGPTDLFGDFLCRASCSMRVSIIHEFNLLRTVHFDLIIIIINKTKSWSSL